MTTRVAFTVDKHGRPVAYREGADRRWFRTGYVAAQNAVAQGRAEAVPFVTAHTVGRETMLPACRDGAGEVTSHEAEGWLVSPEGRRIVAQCQLHAQTAIHAYFIALGEVWTYEAAQ